MRSARFAHVRVDQGKPSRIQLANWQIVNVTSPANYFHVLRRQVINL